MQFMVDPGAGTETAMLMLVRPILARTALKSSASDFLKSPFADATIGGMAACGASGTAAVKYGTMRENVLAATAVLPPTTILSAADADGNATNATAKVVRCGTNALKSSAGYNLPAILVGSEGTLGVMTDVTVKLHPVPPHVIAASCQFADLHSAAEAVAMIRMMNVPVSRIELLDETSIEAFNRTLGGERSSDGAAADNEQLNLRPMDVKPTLFMEFSGHSELAASEDLSAARRVCADEFGATGFASASDESTRRALWAARHRLYYAVIALRAGTGEGDDEGATPQSTVLADACVPLRHFADVVSATARDVEERGVVGPCFGHAGDGNFHCILPLKKNDAKEYRENVFEVVEKLTDRAIRLGGTCTGEHGIGYGKKKYLKMMYGDGGVSMMKALKKSMDPYNIMNPGKIVDNDFYGGFRRG